MARSRLRPPKSEEARRAQLRLVLAAAGFFVLAVIGSVVGLAWETMNSAGFRDMMESMQRVREGGETDAQKGERLRRRLEADRKAGDDKAIVQDAYDYGDFLYQKKKFEESKQIYIECAEASKKCGYTAWYAAALARQGYAMHKLFLTQKVPPDAAPVEEAIRVNKENDNDTSWGPILGLIYHDLGQTAKAQKVFADALAEVKALQAKGKPGRIDWDDLDDLARALDYAPDRQQVRDQVVKLWSAEDYVGLDKLAKQLRVSPDENVRGEWKVHELYDAITSPAEHSDAKFHKLVERCAAWSAKMPAAVTPHVIAAIAWRDYAWKARGSGWANSVTEEGWKLFRERLEKAQAEVDAAMKCTERCPYQFSSAQRVALGRSMEKPDYEKLVATGLKQYPSFTPIYNAQAWYLQPRWFGEDDEWTEVAQRECDKLGATAGDIMYARIVWSLMSTYDDGTIFTEAHADRARTQRGFAALRKQFPNSAQVAEQETRLNDPPDSSDNKG